MEKKVMELANELREAGLNFIIVVEDKGIHSQSNIKGNSLLRDIAKMIKKIK